MTKKTLQTLLLAWVVVVVFGGLHRSNTLSGLLNGNGPLTLANAGDGGSWVASRNTLYRLDADERLLARTPATSLGLVEINSLATGHDSILWIYDSHLLRPFRCQTQPLHCSPFGPDNLKLGINVLMTENSRGELLLSDNTHHRIVRLSATGTLLDNGEETRRHYPNQISAHPDGVYLADTDRFEIVTLPDAATGSGQQVLRSERRPYRFVNRGQEWWVIEAGSVLERGVVRHYRNGQGQKLDLGIQDPSAIIDNGRRLLVTSLTDWKLVSIDPATGSSRSVNDAALMREFTEQHRLMTEARQDRSKLPLFMIALMLPAIGVAGLLQKDRKSEPETVAEKPLPTPRPESIRTAALSIITPDLAALEKFQAQSRQKLLRAGLYFLGITVVLGLALVVISHISDSFPLDSIWLMLGLMIGLALLLAYITYAAQRKQRKEYDQRLTLGKDRVVWSRYGKPRAAIPYKDIWIGPDELLLGRHRLPLYLKAPGQRVPLWPVSDIQREIGMRIPAHQSSDTTLQFMKSLAKHGRLTDAFMLVLTKAGPVLAILLLLILKVGSRLDDILLYLARN